MATLRVRICAAAVAVVGTSFGLTTLIRAETPSTRPVQQDAGVMARIDDLASAMRNVGHAIEPSVVSIEIEKKSSGVSLRGRGMDEDMLKRFFPDRDGDGQPDLPRGFKLPSPDGEEDDDGDGQGPTVFGEGSGVILDVDGNTGYILTNNHVAGDATKLRVTLADGRKIEQVEVVGTDPLTDLAVIKIEGEDLKAAKWGKSETLEKGDIVLAFGAPFGYVGSMTQGIVSALNRSEVGILGQNGYENFIQTDCAINPGNSGGPLVNVHGEVVGINTAIATRSGGFAGIGFAIPSQLAQHVYNELKSEGKVTRGYLGVKIADVSSLRKNQARRLGLAENQQGVFIDEIPIDSPSDGKLEPNDVVVSIDGQPVKNRTELRFKIATMTPGSNVKLGVIRGGEKQDVEIKLGTLPGDENNRSRQTNKDQNNGANHANKDIGATLGDATTSRLRSAGLPNGAKGALVTEVRPGSLADEAGLKPNDLIKKVAGKAVNNAAEATAAIREQDFKEGFDIIVQSNEGTRSVYIQSDDAK